MKTIDNFTQKIKAYDKNGNKKNVTIFDALKIWNDTEPNQKQPVLVYIIMSPRGIMAKSTQCKYLAKSIYDNYGLKTLWMMNDEELIKKEKRSHLVKPKQFHQDIFNDDMSISGDYVYATPNEYEEKYDKNNKLVSKKITEKAKWYTKFVVTSMAEKEKGSRDDYGMIIWDEFNIADRMIKNYKTELIASLMGTTEDAINKHDPNVKKIKKLIILANYKSINDPFLTNLGITKIDGEITNLVGRNKQVFGRVILPLYNEQDKQEIEDDNENNPVYWFLDAMGQAEHNYTNTPSWDEINFVNDWMITLDTLSTYAIYVYGNYYQVRLANSKDKDLKGIMYIIPYTPAKNEQVFALHRGDTKEGIIYNPNMKQTLYKMLGRSKLYFKNVVIRDNVIKRLRV